MEEEEEEEEEDAGDDHVDPDLPPGGPGPSGGAGHCPECGHQNLDVNFRFCSGCGAPRPAGSPPAAPGAGNHPGSVGAASIPADVSSASSVRQKREGKLVKQREVANFKVPLLAGDAAEQRGWVNTWLAYMRRFDAGTKDFLYQWAHLPFQEGVTKKQLLDPEGLHHLDSLIAADMLDPRHYKGRESMAPLYLELQAYSYSRRSVSDFGRLPRGATCFTAITSGIAWIGGGEAC